MRPAIILVATLLPVTVAFVPNAAANTNTHHIYTRRILEATKSEPDEIDFDINHAKYCADNFGECSLDDLEHMRNALHRERIEHTFTNTAGLQNPHGVEEDVEHTVLENTLTFQAGLLQDKLATEQMQQDSMSKYGMNPYSSTLNAPVLDGGLDEESSEALVICLAIAGLTLVPQLLGN